MKAEGFATVMAGSLALSIADADWHFSIRRVDGKTHGPFFDFHGKKVSAEDIAKFLPNWETLQWTEIQDGLLSKSESYAKDVEFKVNVQAPPSSISLESHGRTLGLWRGANCLRYQRRKGCLTDTLLEMRKAFHSRNRVAMNQTTLLIPVHSPSTCTKPSSMIRHDSIFVIIGAIHRTLPFLCRD